MEPKMTEQITVQKALTLALQALRGAGMPENAAQSCARALVLAEQDGLPSHRLSRLPFYLEQIGPPARSIDAKGAALTLMVELLTAGLTGSHFSFQASSFFDAEGDAPGVAHFLFLIDPARLGSGYLPHVETLFMAMLDQPGVRLTGQRRIVERQERSEFINLPRDLVEELQCRADRRPQHYP
jgi:LDH2 family malate/lactate/ureidoglycolate dehydrogenase